MFYIDEGEEIAGEGREKYFGEEALKDLTRFEIFGTAEGFKVIDGIEINYTRFYSKDSVYDVIEKKRIIEARVLPRLELRDKTRIEPVTEEEMKLHKKLIEGG